MIPYMIATICSFSIYYEAQGCIEVKMLRYSSIETCKAELSRGIVKPNGISSDGARNGIQRVSIIRCGMLK